VRAAYVDSYCFVSITTFFLTLDGNQAGIARTLGFRCL
jgi:hypothetical protein